MQATCGFDDWSFPTYIRATPEFYRLTAFAWRLWSRQTVTGRNSHHLAGSRSGAFGPEPDPDGRPQGVRATGIIFFAVFFDCPAQGNERRVDRRPVLQRKRTAVPFLGQDATPRAGPVSRSAGDSPDSNMVLASPERRRSTACTSRFRCRLAAIRIPRERCSYQITAAAPNSCVFPTQCPCSIFTTAARSGCWTPCFSRCRSERIAI